MCTVAGMSQHKRQRWNEADAREVIERIEREGKSIPQVARELGVTPQRIYWWWHHLKDESPLRMSPGTNFVEVSVSHRISTSGFTIHTRGGRQVDVCPGFDAQELSRLLSVVEALPC